MSSGEKTAAYSPIALGHGGGGDMGDRIRAFEWSKTPLGPNPLAAEPTNGRQYPPFVALRNVDGLGPGTDDALQRRVPANARNQAPLGSRDAGKRGLA